MIRAYVAGPMRGRPDFNRAEFHRVSEYLRANGWDVINPHETEAAWQVGALASRAHCVADIASISLCSHVIVLDGWEGSVGATAEVACARWMNIPISTPDGRAI